MAFAVPRAESRQGQEKPQGSVISSGRAATPAPFSKGILMTKVHQSKFPLGRVVITRNALETIPAADVSRALHRHASGDWGDLCEDDRQENELSLKEGYRLLSAYHAADGSKFWIITEADRSVTTVLLPDDY